jgi:hypothetical protein
MVVMYVGMKRKAWEKPSTFRVMAHGQARLLFSRTEPSFACTSPKQENLVLLTQGGAMKAKSYLLAISLAANLVLGWMLWQRHPATSPEPVPVLVQSMPSEEERLPLPTTSMPLTASPLLPLMGAALPDPGQSPSADSRASLLPAPGEKPYGPPPPPNPHATPPWPERLPHGESQTERALITK